MLDLLKNGKRWNLNSMIKTWRARIGPAGVESVTGEDSVVEGAYRRSGGERTGGGDVRVPPEKTGSVEPGRVR
jgi:hypothetical protein